MNKLEMIKNALADKPMPENLNDLEKYFYRTIQYTCDLFITGGLSKEESTKERKEAEREYDRLLFAKAENEKLILRYRFSEMKVCRFLKEFNAIKNDLAFADDLTYRKVTLAAWIYGQMYNVSIYPNEKHAENKDTFCSLKELQKMVKEGKSMPEGMTLSQQLYFKTVRFIQQSLKERKIGEVQAKSEMIIADDTYEYHFREDMHMLDTFSRYDKAWRLTQEYLSCGFDTSGSLCTSESAVLKRESVGSDFSAFEPAFHPVLTFFNDFLLEWYGRDYAEEVEKDNRRQEEMLARLKRIKEEDETKAKCPISDDTLSKLEETGFVDLRNGSEGIGAGFNTENESTGKKPEKKNTGKKTGRKRKGEIEERDPESYAFEETFLSMAANNGLAV